MSGLTTAELVQKLRGKFALLDKDDIVFVALDRLDRLDAALTAIIELEVWCLGCTDVLLKSAIEKIIEDVRL